MKQYPPERVRNVVLLSHGGAGKTTLAEAMLYTAKATTRLGRVEEGNTVSDWDPDEIKRHISVSTAVLPLEWRDHKINVLDAPGYADFVGEIKSALRAADAAVIVLCAASGVEVGSEQIWTYLDEARLPRLIFMNKLDRENANFSRTIEQAQASWGNAIIPLHLPIGSEASFSGYVDLLSRTAYSTNGKNDGSVEKTSIPGDLADAVEEARQALIELLFLPWPRLGRVDLVQLKAQQLRAPAALLLRHGRRRQPRAQAAPARVGARQRLALGLQARVAVQRFQLDRRPRQRLVFVLAGKIRDRVAQRRQRRHRRGLGVDQGACLARGVQLAPRRERPGRDLVALAQVGGQVHGIESPLHFQAVGARSQPR